MRILPDQQHGVAVGQGMELLDQGVERSILTLLR